MKWNKFRIETTTEAEDLVSSMLMDLGIQGIEIEDNIPMSQREKEQMFVDILPETELPISASIWKKRMTRKRYLQRFALNLRICVRISRWEADRLRSRRRKMWTGSITGRNIFISST